MADIDHDREYLEARGWKEANRVGAWRWWKVTWRPICYYTLREAANLERSISKQVEGKNVGH